MRSTFRFGEFVHVAQRNKSGIPDEFLWRGRRHRIRRLVLCRDDHRRSSDGMQHHRLYLIQTTTGLRCVLSYDVAGNAWRLERMVLSEG